MLEFINKNKITKIKKRGTYSRLLQKYRKRFKQAFRNNPATQEVNSALGEPETFHRHDPGNVENIGTVMNNREIVEHTESERKIVTDIRKWSAENNIPQTALKSLIDVLNSNLQLDLPKDPRSIMRTPRNVDIRPMGEGGQYWHQGLEPCLRRIFRDIRTDTSISININIDGLPIYKSTTKNFWPILCNIYEIPSIAPIVVGIFYGYGKPKDVNAFLNPFIDELLKILESGIIIHGHRLSIHIRCFVCDTPARSFIKNVTNFNGKYGCIKCTTKGRFSQLSRTMTYPELNAPLRTDKEFRENQYPDHQRGYTPLVKLPIDMVNDIIVGDSLHLLELGVMKKMITSWRTGSMSMKAKWGSFQKKEISEYLIQVKFPVEINRKMRSLEFVSLWKGLEYRHFLNYVGIVILKDHLPEKFYDHFLYLFCAVRICSAENYANLLPVARSLIIDFIEDFKALYGTEFVSSNVHNLCHIVSEVERFGPLPTFTAYPFENYMHSLKKIVRTGPNPLAQIAARIIEAANSKSSEGAIHQNHATIAEKQGRIILAIKNFQLSTNFEDRWFLTKQCELIRFNDVSRDKADLLIFGSQIIHKYDFFQKPFKSSHIHIYIAKVKSSNYSNTMHFNIHDVFCKLVPLHRKEGIVFIPLLHTIQ
ncbi:uncharacterized protein LOC110678452 [Aedes aegypti]|uniref:Transposase domain-containing protein n=1 Tax=Aedes aegypti TaxID=7159 RepID=A0A6I8U0B5_AEDAE|nr:uncharacterized protein LOC110677920 [Aedes aegypti]XP_021707059.1 uncharacterized protein LOC110678452 [Aedes aegypti]